MIKTNILKAVCIFVLTVNIIAQNKIVDLDEFKWENRIILTFSNDESVNKSIEEKLVEEKVEVADRDIIYFLFNSSEVVTNSKFRFTQESKSELISRFFNQKEKLKVILIGKDGAVKMEKSEFDLGEIFRRIDGMPMRIREMQIND